MEGAGLVDLGMGKRDVSHQEGNGNGLESAIPYDQHPKKFIRTASFPFRTVASSAAVTVTSASLAAAAATPQLPPLYPSSGAYNGSAGGPSLYHNSGGGICNSAAKALQPFSSSFKSQAVGMGHAVTLRCTPFTPAQWQELNRQALIYKHLVSSAPVPPDLLFDPRAVPGIPPLYPNLDRGGGRCFNLPFTNNTDPEPGRCRRTDGKKWRCSRDVAPDQKYCERHMHRGRPRSRKPVELRRKTCAASAARDIMTSTTTTTTSPMSTTAMDGVIPNPYGQSPPTVKRPFLSMAAPEKEPRYLDLLKGGLDEIHSHEKNIGPRTSNPLALHQYEEQLKSNNLNDPCNSFLNQYLSSLDTALDLDHRCPPRSFIDAWSNDKSPLSSAAKLSPSTLTLSMSGTGMEDADQIHMGLGINDSVGRSQPLSWMNPVTPPGGPLAEVLQSGATSTSSPHNRSGEREGSMSTTCAGFRNCHGNDGVMSPRDSPTRVVSSPTGVLQRTFVSLSDSSGNSSPTFVTGGGRSEMGRLHWPGLSQ